MKDTIKDTLKFYKVFVTQESKNSKSIHPDYGFILTRRVEPDDLLSISKYFHSAKLNSSDLVKTLFSKKDLVELNILEKLIAQINHYEDNSSSIFTTELEGKKISLDIIKVVTEKELEPLILEDAYTSKPLPEEKVEAIHRLIKAYNFQIDMSKIKNNELRCYFLENANTKLSNIKGEDVLRLVNKIYTDSSLLIKSKANIEIYKNCSLRVREQDKIESLLNMYTLEVSQVFNRFKSILISMKTNDNTTKGIKKAINKISKLSKKNHVPLIEKKSKSFISRHVNKVLQTLVCDLTDIEQEVANLTTAEKIKILNVVQDHLSYSNTRSFLIRNGSVFTKEVPENDCNKQQLLETLDTVLYNSLVSDLSKKVKRKVIKYNKYIDYALPVSEKMSCDNLPFGTEVSLPNKNSLLVAGMYWENSWGSEDLDISTISISGKRTGWGQLDSYSDDTLFSGDITDAPYGAIEFIANKGKEASILINNIYNGCKQSKFKIVIGENKKNQMEYVDNTLLELNSAFKNNSETMALGALYKDRFILYPVSLGSKSVSSKKNKAVLPKMIQKMYRLRSMLISAGAIIINKEDFKNNEEHIIDIDLSVENITFNSLLDLFNN